MEQSQQENFRALLTEAIVKLCQMEAVYTEELRIEGTVCVVLDHSSVVIAHFRECVGYNQSLESENVDGSECVFKEHNVNGVSASGAELQLPELKMEHDINTFQGVGTNDSSSVIHDLCDEALRSLNTAETSQIIGNHGWYHCPHCDKSYRSCGTLQNHMKTHHRHQTLTCHHCSAMFSSLSLLQMHVGREHDNWCNSQSSGRLKQQQCDAPLETEQIDGAEYNANTPVSGDDEISRGCFEIDRTNSLALLEAMERKDYETMIDETTQLLMTDDQSLKPSGRQQGVASGKSKKPVSAGKSTVMQYFEKIHLETSQGLYQYQCCLCNKMFKLRTSLYEHISSHSGRRRYECNQCGRRFVHHSSLHNHVRNKHMVTPQGKMRYLCNGCDRSFRFRSQFDRHLKSHPQHCYSSPQTVTSL